MATVTKFDISKFDRKMSFNIWNVQMMAVLTQNGLKKALSGKTKKPTTMTDEQWEELDEKALSIIQLCMVTHVLHEVLDKTTTVDLWLRLEALYMTKSPPNKTRLKERLYLVSMAEDTPIQNHRNEFNSIIFDLKSLDVKIKNEDKEILLAVSLPPPISTSRKFCYTVTLILYLLRMLRKT